MSASFSIRVYGEVDQEPPYLPNAAGNLPAISATYSQEATLAYNFPTDDILAYPIAAPGAVMGGNTSCYGVIEIPPTGLNEHGKKYVVQQTLAQIATLRNA